MFNELEKRSMYGMLEQQNVITEEEFYVAYKDRENNKVEVIEDCSLEGERILGVINQARVWYLQSRYDAGKAAKLWAKQYGDKTAEEAVYIVFGLGDGRCIEELCKVNKNAMVIVYEPCAEIFWRFFGDERIVNLIERNKVAIVVKGINDQLYGEYLDAILNYANYRLAQVCVLPNYDKLFLEQYKWMLDKYLYCVKRITLDRNTELLYSQEIIKNTLGLSKDVVEQSSIVQLRNIVEKNGLLNMPAVLVAAGPSLDKNIDELVELQESVFIMAVDTALNTVLQHGIMPDMTITVDGHKPVKLFMHEKVKEVPIALSVMSNKEILPYISSKRFYELSPEEYLGGFYNEMGKTVQGLPTGGSVANNALSLLTLMGFKTIIFMGQDLSYPEGKTHTIEAYSKDESIDLQDKKYIKIKDIYDNDVYTEANMYCYLQWFEKYISILPSIRFIDATEGGAKIAGTEIRSMKEVAAEYVSCKYNKKDIWIGIDAYLTQSEQEEMKEKICNIPNVLKDIEKIIKKGLQTYDKLDEINRKHGTVSSMAKLIDKIMEYNETLDGNAVFDLVKRYAISIDYDVKGSVLLYNRDDDMYTQIEDVVRQGRRLFEGYQKAVNEMYPDLEGLIKEFK